jgi:hypothetical protein
MKNSFKCVRIHSLICILSHFVKLCLNMEHSPNLLTISCLSLGTSCNINQLIEQFQHNDMMFHVGNKVSNKCVKYNNLKTLSKQKLKMKTMRRKLLKMKKNEKKSKLKSYFWNLHKLINY